MAILTYIHDPMCSWCFGFSNALGALMDSLPATIQVHRLLGGLASDTDEPMPAEMKTHVRSNWERIEQRVPGVTFNYEFWGECQPRRSTYPACRAVISARAQGAEYDIEMTKAIQQAYYGQARNPSDNSMLIALAAEIGIDQDVFAKALTSDAVHTELIAEITAAKQMCATSFPSLKLQIGETVWPISINYTDPEEMLELIEMLAS